ncbi:hypothetical protein L6452_39895 [Arctium lappa]|uniref:Uncharacterized protein n=1 Tax=Arctium lappa TaxID=4217 RepID=A0ACB8XTJ3_ARCLA|nr:hypothetical protein L6452_39895 [Arctium lappa]
MAREQPLYKDTRCCCGKSRILLRLILELSGSYSTSNNTNKSRSSSSSSPLQAQAADEVQEQDEAVMGSEDMLKRIGGLEVWKACNYS